MATMIPALEKIKQLTVQSEPGEWHLFNFLDTSLDTYVAMEVILHLLESQFGLDVSDIRYKLEEGVSGFQEKNYSRKMSYLDNFQGFVSDIYKKFQETNNSNYPAPLPFSINLSNPDLAKRVQESEKQNTVKILEAISANAPTVNLFEASLDDFSRDNRYVSQIIPGLLKTLRTKVKNGNSNFNSSFIALLENLVNSDGRIKYATIEVAELPEGEYGAYDPTNRKIIFAPSIPNIPEMGINFENVLVHEIIHAATVDAPQQVKDKIREFLDAVNAKIRENIQRDLNAKDNAALNRVKNLFKKSKAKETSLEEALETFYSDFNYQSLLNPEEFVADFFRNKELANLLSDMDATGVVKIRGKGLFQTIVEFVKDIFKLNKTREKFSALAEAAQLVSDAITLGSQKAVTSRESIEVVRNRLNKINRMNSANILYKAGVSSENMKFIPKVLNALTQVRGNEAAEVLKNEIGVVRGISPVIQYIHSLYENNIIDTNDMTPINSAGTYSKEFLKRALEYMQEDNFQGLLDFMPRRLPTVLSVRDRVIVSDGQRVSAKPVVKYNNNFYSVVSKRNGNYALTNLDRKERMEVSFDHGVVTNIKNGTVLEGAYSSLFYSEKAPTRDTRMVYAYNNDLNAINVKTRALVREITFQIDELLETKRKTNPAMTREELLDNMTFLDLQGLIYAQLKYYSDMAVDSNREAVGLFSEHIDAFLDRTIAHLQFTEGIKLNSRMVTQKARKTKENLNPEDLTEVTDETSEEDSQGDDLLEAGETQNIQYKMRADTKKVFDRTSIKVKRALYNLVDFFGQPDDVTGNLPTIDINLSKDVVLEALNNVFDAADIVPALEYYSESYPFLSDLLYMIEEDPELLTQIYNSFALTNVDALSVRPDRIKPFQLINFSSLKYTKTSEWAAAVSNGTRLDPDLNLINTAGVQNGKELIGNIERIVTFSEGINKDIASFSKLTDQEKENMYPSITNRLYKLLHSVGVETSKERMDMYLRRELHESSPLRTVVSLTRTINSILKSVAKNASKPGFSATSSEISKKLEIMFSKIFSKLSTIDFQRGESYVSEGSKGYYLNREPSYVAKMMNGFRSNTVWQSAEEKMERRSKFLQDNYFKYVGTYSRKKPVMVNGRETIFFSDLLHRLVNDPKFANNNTYVSFKNFNDGSQRTEFDQLDKDTQLAVLMSGFMTNKDSDEAFYPLPVLSDSPEIGFIKGIRYGGSTYKRNIVTNLTQLAVAELQRIMIIDKAKKDGTMPDVANLKSRGDSFVKFPFLEEIKDELLTLSPVDMVERIQEEFTKYLEERAEAFVNNFVYTNEEGSVITAPENILKVMDSVADTVEEFKDKLFRYYYNQYNAYAEFTHVLGIDPALYKNPVDYQKRFKQIYSHGTPLDVNAKVPEVIYDAETGNLITTGEFVQSGKQKRVSLVLSDYTVYSNVSDQMIEAMETAFPDLDQRIRVLTKLGVFNTASANVDGKYYTRNIISGEFFEGDKPITMEEYFTAVGDNVETRFYTDRSGRVPVSYETQRMSITDGQTFISLNEMRSMMSMYSNWNIQNEIDYQKYKVLKENNLPVDDALTEFHISIKSFYFSTDELKVDGRLIKNNVHFKHSEALLMPNEIMRGSELLQAVSNFLENPPIVTVHGVQYEVGAISFDSAQKVGSVNVVDINDVSPRDVEQVLRNAVEQGHYVVTDYNSYIIKQPTKNYITNNTKQLIGTQPRRILYSNIPDGVMFEIQGKSYNKEQYINILNNVINSNIKRDFDKLRRKFTSNKALSELLIDNILSNTRYAKDLVEAFRLGANGNFQLPLFNPANAIMVERMITSIIRTNLTKEYIRGGKVVNTSNFGYSHDLKIEFERRGDILVPTFFETYMPFPGTMEEWNKLHDADGNFMWDKVDPKFREVMFYRIPTESKYSMVPMRVKAFLPPSSGVSMILPSEILTLTGMDFDFDSMYGFIYDYIFTDDGRIEVKESADPDSFLDDNLGMAQQVSDTAPSLESVITPPGTTPERAKVSRNGSVNNLFIDMALSNLNNVYSVNERFKICGFDSIMGVSYDIQLLKQGMSRQELEELNKRPDATRIKKDMVKSEVRDINTIDNDLHFRNQNITSKSNVALFVSNKSARNFMSSLRDVFLETTAKRGNNKNQFDLLRSFVKSEDERIRLNGMEYLNDDGMIERASDDITEDVSASVDITKSPVHPNLGVTKRNVRVYNMLRMMGVDRRKIASLIANPMISWDQKYQFVKFRKPSTQLLDLAKRFTEIYDYKLGYDLLSGDAPHGLVILEAAERHGVPDEGLSQMDAATLSEILNYMADGMKTYANVIGDFNRVTKSDAVNSGPNLSVESMVSMENNFNRTVNNERLLNRVTVSSDFDNNFVINFYKYSFENMLDILNDKFNVNVIRKAQEYFPKYDTINPLVTAAYLNYGYDNASFYDGTKVTNEILEAFPNYFLQSMRSDSKYDDSWLLNNLGLSRGGFFINSHERPDRDKVASEWMRIYNDPNHRADAYNLAVYSFFRRDKSKGLNNLFDMIPSTIQREMGLFEALDGHQELLDEYLMTEAIDLVRRGAFAPMDITRHVRDGDGLDFAFEFITRNALGVKSPERFYRIEEDTYYYDPLNSRLDNIEILKENLPTSLRDKSRLEAAEFVNNEDMDNSEESVVSRKGDGENKMDETPYDVSIFASEEYKEIKNLDSIQEILDSLEHEIIEYAKSENPLLQDIHEAHVTYMEDMMDYSSCPEFENKSEEEIQSEINDINSCL